MLPCVVQTEAEVEKAILDSRSSPAAAAREEASPQQLPPAQGQAEALAADPRGALGER